MEIEKRALGLRLIRWSVIISILRPFLSLIPILFLFFVKDLGENIDFYLRLSIISVYSSMLILILSLIFLGVGIFKMRKDPRYGSIRQQRNLKISFIFFWIVIAILILQYIMGLFLVPRDIDQMATYSIIRSLVINPFNLVSRFLFMMTLILPIWRLSNDRSRDFIFSYFILMLLAYPFFNFGLLIIFLIGFPILFPLNGLLITIFPSFILITASILMIFAYSKAIRISETKKKLMEKGYLKSRFLFRGKFPYLIKKPVPVIVIFFIIGLLLGSVSALMTYSYYNEKERDNRGSFEVVRELTSEKISITDELREGESNEHEISIRQEVASINVTLKWTDEDTERLKVNEPDTFRIRTSLGNGEEDEREEMGSNSDNGVGNLEISYSFGVEHGQRIDEVLITVELTEAGDIIGPLGIIVREADSSNGYDLIIEVNYIEEIIID